MRVGKNTAHAPGKSTDLCHCHSALQSNNVSGAKLGDTIQTVLETTGVPVTGAPPMLMSNAVYCSWISIYMLNNKRLR